MAQDDLEAGICVEHPTQDETYALRCGFDGKAPGGAQQRRILSNIVLVINVDNCWMRYRWVHVERYIERLRPLEDRPEPFVVEKEPIGQTVHQGTLEAVP